MMILSSLKENQTKIHGSVSFCFSLHCSIHLPIGLVWFSHHQKYLPTSVNAKSSTSQWLLLLAIGEMYNIIEADIL